MRFPRISVANTRLHVIEEVDGDIATFWLLPHHGCYPSEAIARAVARTHQCDDSKIRPVQFYQAIYKEAT